MIDFTNEAVFTKVKPGSVDAVLYQAMFDETIRLRKCPSRRERENIRKFLTVAYQQLSSISTRIDPKGTEFAAGAAAVLDLILPATGEGED